MAGLVNFKDRVFLSMQFDGKDYEPLMGHLKDFAFIENSAFFLPTLQLTFHDRDNRLLGFLGISGADKLRFRLGRNEKEAEEYEMHLFSVKDAQITAKMDIGSTYLTVPYWGKLWKPLFYKEHVRSWDKAPASDPASVIADEVGAKAKAIETSQDERAYIQAQWTNAVMLRHLAWYAVGTIGAGGYWYWFDRYDRFVFMTPDRILAGDASQKTHDLEFSNVPKRIFEDEKETVLRQNIILAWKFYSNYKMSLLQRGYGNTVKYWDYCNKEYLEKEILYTDIGMTAISDYVYMETADVTPDRHITMGTFWDYYYKDDWYRRGTHDIQKVVGSLCSLEVVLVGNKDYKMGDIAKVHIPQDAFNEPLMETVSGTWIIGKITHKVDIIAPGYHTKLTLIRSGINNKTGKALVPG